MSVRVERKEQVTVVTIDRPEVRNAVDPETAGELRAAFEAFASDESSSVAVFTGAGGAFCAGYDLKAVASGDGADVEDLSAGPMGPTRMILDKPVIAAVEGYAVAGGLELALWCDLRVAAEDATFGVFNRRFGVPLIDGGTVRLPRIVGHARALDMILTGRAVDAREALSWGLVDRLVAPGTALDVALEMAGEIAAFPQTTMRSDRVSTIEQWGLPLEDALRNEAELGLRSMASGEAQAGASRFAEGTGRHGSFDS
jgi:enoyl-CoA hydratase